MTIHITVIGFGKTPDVSTEAFLSHCGFLEDVGGKSLTGQYSFYEVRTQYPDAVTVHHIAFHDVNIDCRDMALVFQKPFEGIAHESPEMTARAELMGHLLCETAGRLGAVELVREVEGLFEDEEGNMAYVFKNVATAVDDDIAKGIHKQMREVN